jgi:SAM-dependent methyltransferase
VPGHVYFNTYARLHAAVSTRLVYPRSERAGLGTQRERLLGQARGSTVELVGAFIGINLHAYPPDLDELVLLLRHPHMASRLRRELAASGRQAKIVESPEGRLPFEDDHFDTAVATLSLCLPQDVTPELDEVARVLKPGGRLLFMEHVRSDRPGLARWQDRLAPTWRYLAIGCNCNGDTVGALEACGFRIEHIEHGLLPKLGPLVRPLVTGVAATPNI